MKKKIFIQAKPIIQNSKVIRVSSILIYTDVY